MCGVYMMIGCGTSTAGFPPSAGFRRCRPSIWEHDGEDREIWRDEERVMRRWSMLLVHNTPEDVRRWMNMCLWYAAENGYKAVCQFLLEGGADPTWKDAFFGAAIHRAALGNKSDILQLILEIYHWCVDTTDAFGVTALFWASYFGNVNCVRVLLSKGADPEYHETPTDSKIPFHLICDVTSDDSPLSVARKRKHIQIVEMMEGQHRVVNDSSQMPHTEIASLRFDVARANSEMSSTRSELAEKCSMVSSLRLDLAQAHSTISSQERDISCLCQALVTMQKPAGVAITGVSVRAASGRPVQSPRHTLQAVQKQYSSRWYALGREMGFTPDQLRIIDGRHIPECDKLLFMFDEKVAEVGEARATYMLLQACRSIYDPSTGATQDNYDSTH